LDLSVNLCAVVEKGRKIVEHTDEILTKNDGSTVGRIDVLFE